MSRQTIQLGHSPDPDDAFMFYAMAQKPPLIDCGNFEFYHILQDIQTLNQRARQGELEVSAISIHAFPYVADRYALMSCGSSMGDGYGPMIVAREPMRLQDLRGKRIAIPGTLTTAFLTLQLCLGKASDAFDAEVVMFDHIPDAVRDGRFDAGLLIHEGQLTYKDLGLHLVVDLGIWWQESTGLPLPLGGNVVRKDLGPDACQEITDIIRASIQYSLDHRPQAVRYALKFGRDLNEAMADRFVGMYVNHWTLDYGPRGREAITRLLTEGARKGIVPGVDKIEFIEARPR
ncbi:MAG: 1,4-dihydroxy-6-naphtoate synthase [Phycisphaerae bacterium]|jgi:1,4-dihydroxy-6-naphthoate synthase|nr:MAG: 1,4-dihydroxy-6-naphtoate synthase [Phycisphaerae bacterium]